MFESRQSGSTLETSARRQDAVITLNGKQVSAECLQKPSRHAEQYCLLRRFAAYGAAISAQLPAQLVPVRQSSLPSVVPSASAPRVAAGEQHDPALPLSMFAPSV